MHPPAGRRRSSDPARSQLWGVVGARLSAPTTHEIHGDHRRRTTTRRGRSILASHGRRGQLVPRFCAAAISGRRGHDASCSNVATLPGTRRQRSAPGPAARGGATNRAADAADGVSPGTPSSTPRPIGSPVPGGGTRAPVMWRPGGAGLDLRELLEPTGRGRLAIPARRGGRRRGDADHGWASSVRPRAADAPLLCRSPSLEDGDDRLVAGRDPPDGPGVGTVGQPATRRRAGRAGVATPRSAWSSGRLGCAQLGEAVSVERTDRARQRGRRPSLRQQVGG